MTKFGGNTFPNFSVPLSFKGRYFILVPGNPPSFSVVLEHKGKLIFEIKKNKPCDNPITKLSMTKVGIIAVSDKVTGRFLYKFRPENETSIVLGKIDGSEITAKISDNKIQVGSVTLENNRFEGSGIAGILVDENGAISIGAPIPKSLLSLLMPFFNKEEIVKRLSELGAMLPCQRCGHMKFTVLNGYTHTMLQDDINGSLIIGGPTIPSILVACNNCGCLTAHALGGLGLLPTKKGGSQR